MTLNTQCPYCQTQFRVSQDQLMLRAGLVRCGCCQKAFNGQENLLSKPVWQSKSQTQDVLVKSVIPHPIDLSPEVNNTPDPIFSLDLDLSSAILGQDESPLDTVFVAPPPSTLSETPHIFDKPIKRPEKNLRAVSGVRAAVWSRPPLEDLIFTNRVTEQESTFSSESHVEIKDSQPVQPTQFYNQNESKLTFFERPRSQKSVVFPWLYGLGCLLMCVFLLGQLAYYFRNDLAWSFPIFYQPMVRACSILGCKIHLSQNVNDLSIEANDLQIISSGSDRYKLDITLINRSALPQAWPNISLELRDSHQNTVLQTTMSPADFGLGSEVLALGIPAGTEQPLNLYFELDNLKPDSYRVRPIYLKLPVSPSTGLK